MSLKIFGQLLCGLICLKKHSQFLRNIDLSKDILSTFIKYQLVKKNILNFYALLIFLKIFCQILYVNNNFYMSMIIQYSQTFISYKYLANDGYFYLLLAKVSYKQIDQLLSCPRRLHYLHHL